MAKNPVVTHAPTTTLPDTAPIAGELIPSSYLALAQDPKTIKQFLQENVGTSLRSFDLDRVKVPGAGSTTWKVPTLDGPKNLDVIEGIVIAWKDMRSYWPDKYTGGKQPPACTSRDLIVGVGHPGGKCATCPLAQFGSAKDDSGNPAAGQACRQLRMLLVLRDTSMLPLLLIVPPSSYRSVKQYFLRIVSSGLSYWAVTTQFHLVTDKNARGIEYSKAELARGRNLTPTELARVPSIQQALSDLFGQVSVDLADVDDVEHAG